MSVMYYFVLDLAVFIEAINILYQVTRVNSDKAHAWVEIYLDGIGWIPVEVTGGGMQSHTSNIPQRAQKSPTASVTITVGDFYGIVIASFALSW